MAHNFLFFILLWGKKKEKNNRTVMAISEGYIVYNKTIKTTYTYTTCLLY